MPTSTLSARPDATCAAAVELAAAAARAEAGDAVAEHLGVRAEGDRVVTHFFAATLPGYAGWRWAVTVARASRSKLVTLDEVVLLPGEGALLPPEWVPWSERMRPGDLGVGDLLPTAPEDDRLAPAYLLSDDPQVESVAFELGLGRVRVLSKPGRDETAERWYAGFGGPDTPMATQAPERCGTCAFYLPIAGSLRVAFGACGNQFSPRDGVVVSVDSGCGAHSEVVVEAPPPVQPPPPDFDDGMEIERHEPTPVTVIPDPADASAPDASVAAAPTADAPIAEVPAAEPAPAVLAAEPPADEPSAGGSPAAESPSPAADGGSVDEAPAGDAESLGHS